MSNLTQEIVVACRSAAMELRQCTKEGLEPYSREVDSGCMHVLTYIAEAIEGDPQVLTDIYYEANNGVLPRVEVEKAVVEAASIISRDSELMRWIRLLEQDQ